MNSEYKQALGKVLTEKREQQNISQRRLSLIAGISRPTLRGVERGELNPTIDMLLKHARSLDVSLADVLAECERLLAPAEPADCEQDQREWFHSSSVPHTRYRTIALPGSAQAESTSDDEARA